MILWFDGCRPRMLLLRFGLRQSREYNEPFKHRSRWRAFQLQVNFTQPCRKYFNQFTFPQVRESTKIKLAELGNEAGVIGAASLALKFA